MRKIGVLILILLVSIFIINFTNTVIASIEVHNYTLQREYLPYELIKGEINLTISQESFDLDLTCNIENKKISLIKFLEKNSVDYDCFPNDCESGYISSGSGKTSKIIDLVKGEEKFLGFVLNGEKVEVQDLSFKIKSNFGVGTELPLKIGFFNSSFYKFMITSGKFFPSKNYGCYDRLTNIVYAYVSTDPYCEKIYVAETPALQLGAILTGTGSEKVSMKIYDKSSNEIDRCEFLPSETDSCVVDNGKEGFSSGEYYVCIDAKNPTNYKIGTETSNDNCGWVDVPIQGKSNIDFAIFTRRAEYSAAIPVSINITDTPELKNLADEANDYIKKKYNGNCSEDCILFLTFSGINQELEVYDIDLKYKKGVVISEDEIYNVEKKLVLVDFSGVLNLSLTGFNFSTSGKEDLTLKVGNNELIEEGIEVINAPMIGDLYPLNPAAGIPVRFTLETNSSKGIVSYLWNFGDGTSSKTENNSVIHTYTTLETYTITVTVQDKNNITNSKDFVIIAGSPKDALNWTFARKKSELDSIKQEIAKFSLTYQNILNKKLKILEYEDEIKKLEKKLEIATFDTDYLEIANGLQSIKLPVALVTETFQMPFYTDLYDVNLAPVQFIGGGNYEAEAIEEYQNAILLWQRENVKVLLNIKRVYAVGLDMSQDLLVTIYDVSVSSSSGDESYVVISKLYEELEFSGDVSARGAEGATVIILNPEEDKSFQFYFEDDDEPAIFVSPKLSKLDIVANIGICNFNKVCEKDSGEDYKNCRSDCKPVFRTIIWIIFILIFGIVIYAFLQVWYKTRYEKFLFDDRRKLYNLVMFILNARERGLGNSIIRSQLKKQGWPGEKIEYAINKADGKRTGMYEIIPIDQVILQFRKFKIKQNINKDKNKQMNTITMNEQRLTR